MLVRLSLAVGDPELRARLAAAAAGPDTVVSELPMPGWCEADALADCDVVVVDRAALPAEVAVPDLVRSLRDAPAAPDLLLLMRDATAEQRAALLAAGCLAVVSDQLPDASLRDLLAEMARRRSQASELQRQAHDAEADEPFGDFISSNPGMRKFLQVARKLSRSDSTVLILGETGVGKERLARAIHSQSPRHDGPFVVLNCGAVPETLLETELFGHERGAFTGAVRAHRGHFELAHRGTIFLDEVGELPLHLQVKLLRAIQERVVQRVGGETPLHVDVRIIAATNRDLRTEMQERRFRSDLYYRLSVVTLEVPPLRERPDDVATLVDVYFKEFRTQIPTTAQRVSPEAIRVLQAYPWPGNIRELINVVERAVLLCDGDEITPADLPDSLVASGAGAAAGDETRELAAQLDRGLGQLDDDWLHRPLAESRHAWNTTFERAYLTGLLRQTGGRIGETAARAGIDPRSLYAKMKQHGLRKEHFR